MGPEIRYAANDYSAVYLNDDVMRPVRKCSSLELVYQTLKCLLFMRSTVVDDEEMPRKRCEYGGVMTEYLDYDEVMQKYDQMMDWLAHLYV